MAAGGNSDCQYVYIIHKKNHPPDVFKIGYTTRTPSERIDQLNKETGSLFEFEGVYIIRTEEGRKTEKSIHDHLKEYRIKKNKEFFKIGKDELRSKIEELGYKLEYFEGVEILEIVMELESKFDELCDDWTNFELKCNKKGYKFYIIECNCVKCIKYEKVDNDRGAFEQVGFYLHSKDDGKLKDKLCRIKSDIIYYIKTIERVRKDHEIIYDILSREAVDMDTKQLLDCMKETKGNLSNIQKEYKWDDDGTAGGSEPSSLPDYSDH